MIANLHNHSLYSDGVEPPEKIVEMAGHDGIELLSLTDHNTLEGYPRFEAACEACHLSYVTGVEIDADEPSIGYRSELLAYFPQGGEEAIAPLLERKRQAALHSVTVALERAAALYHCNTLSIKEEMEMAIREKGFVGMLSHKFTYLYLKEKGISLPAYTILQNSTEWKEIWSRNNEPTHDSLTEMISLIAASGGFPVMPHFGFFCALNPTLMLEKEDYYLTTLKKLKETGLWGMELHPYRYLPQADKINHVITQWTHHLGLHLTRGSDFHGGISAHNRYNAMSGEFEGFKKD